MKKIISILLISILFLTSCASSTTTDTSPISKTNFFFDTVVTISIYDSTDETIIDGCFELCTYYESLFSRTIDTSEVSLINNSTDPVTVSDETIQILNEATKYSSLSSGKFDITISKLSSLWNFTGDNPSVPNDSDINSALSTVNYKDVVTNGNSVDILNDETMIDLGGIAKGFIADKIKEFLLSKDVHSAIINLGGNILMVGTKPDGTDFNIGIQKPFSDRNESILYIKGSDLSVVSSGVYERYFYENDVLYHHILDTSTGYPVDNGLLSVTIVSYISAEGDALSTGCFALGLEKGTQLIESLDGVEAVFVDKDYNITYSSGLILNGDTLTIK